MSELYNYEYYHNCCGPIAYEDPAHWIEFFGNIADRIIKDLNPTTVLDAGCAMGYLVAALRDRNVEAYGVDISEYAISKVRDDIKPYCAVGSLTESLPDNLPEQYDLVVTIEVLEHLYEEDGKKAISNLCKLSDRIIFSSTPDDFMERTHFNVQQREYWARLFAAEGFYDDLNYRPTYLTAYASCYKKSGDWLRQVEDYERNIRIGEAEHDHSVLEWRGAVNDKEQHIQNLTAIHATAEEQWAVQEKQYCLQQERDAQILAEQDERLKQYQLQQEMDKHLLEEQTKQLEANAQDLAEKTELLEKYLLQHESDKQTLAEQVEQLEQSQVKWESSMREIAKQAELLGRYKLQHETDEQMLAEQVEQLEQSQVKWESSMQELAKQAELLNEYRLRQETDEQLLADKEMRCNEIGQELAAYQEHYQMAIAQREELRGQLAQVQNAYNVISNAFFWKITKPFRFILDGVKLLLKKNYYTHLFCKGLKCWKENGFSYTWQKMKLRNGHNAVNFELPADEDIITDVPLDSNILENGPKFSVLVPLYNTPEKYMREMIQSVINQSYTNWELCLADGSTDGNVEIVCQEYARADSRIRYIHLSENCGIAGNSDACADMASGEYLALLDHDDILSRNALYENAKAILETQADVLYSDEDHLSPLGKHISPFYKPDWSPDLLYSQMYICHLLVIRHDLFVEVGGFRSEMDGSQDYDLMLRLSERTERICHIPEILYSWRESENSTAANVESKPYAHTAGKRALDEHLKRRYGAMAYAADSDYTFVFDARFFLPRNLLVSIIIPMKDKWEMTDACVQSILTKSTYRNFELLLLDNRSEEAETKRWMERISAQDSRIRVVAADMEFNWSKLNNFGVSHAHGDVFIFLNNDTLVISEDWIERLSENACRDDIGLVGALLLYPDETIQHAGVVVGIGDWADHIFKGMQPTHYGSPFVSPMVSRNVLAVTGACMAVSRKTWNSIGEFDEEFIICGSDVEYGIRAYEHGLFNRYDVNVKLFHLESKSRDSYIPEVDFQKSYEAYTPYRENIDPFFNINLDRASVIPKEKAPAMGLINFKNYLKRCPLIAKAYQAIKNTMMEPYSYNIPEIGELAPRSSAYTSKTGIRLNLLIPSVDQKYVFGGIATAISFFNELQRQSNFPGRIIVTDDVIRPETMVALDGYTIVDCMEDSNDLFQLITVADRYQKTFPVAENDVFVATGWWTAYIIADVIRWQIKTFGKVHPLVYLIQDYEPGFYPWSSRYLLADSTYRLDIPTIAVMNSSILKEFFEVNQYHFKEVFSFEPHLNEKLKEFLPTGEKSISKKKQILVYGRPSVARNAFELLVHALKAWSNQQPGATDWTVLSAGEHHDDIDLGNGVTLHSVGKLSLEGYAQLMLETYAGVSLMVSPHPSYPPLEMAAFGIRTITNCYGNKDLSTFSDNIISLQSCSPLDVANTLHSTCNGYIEQSTIIPIGSYVNKKEPFDHIVDKIIEELRE